MAVTAAPIVGSAFPLSLGILAVVALLAALAAAGYLIGRMYVQGRFDIRNWK